jgi:hypothetical protein
MSKEARWIGIAVGISAGILAWVVKLHQALWSAHPQWMLLAIVCGVGVVCSVMIERGERRSRDRVQKA